MQEDMGIVCKTREKDKYGAAEVAKTGPRPLFEVVSKRHMKFVGSVLQQNETRIPREAITWGRGG